uniref:Uncharacterized protein n=1 Tax=Anopheles epiroticus TaxID=199890 RepID=A0A182PNA7_9DIPT
YRRTEEGLCITEQHQRGRCVPVKQCDSVLTTLRKEALTNEDIQYLYGTECGRTVDGKALVCCPQSALIPVLNTPVRVSGGDDAKRPAGTSGGTKSIRTVCGLQSAPELSDRTLGHHPWTVLLHHGSQGEYDLESTVDCILSPETDDLICADPSYDVPVAQVILHEAYTGRRNDIALLKLSRPAELNDWIRPVCLPASPVLNETATYSAAGWQQNPCEGTNSRYKQLSRYYALNQTDCQRYVSSVAGTAYSFVCVATEGEQPVMGDAGGGLTVANMIQSDRPRPVHELFGVLSPLSSCANFDGVSVYTRVAQYVSWIESRLESTGGGA